MSRIKQDVIDKSTPSAAHWFIRMLDLKQKLLRLYSQNIDGLERATGMTESRTVKGKHYKGGFVLLHGTIQVLRCQSCCFCTSWDASAMEALSTGVAHPCPECLRRGELYHRFYCLKPP